MVKHTKRIRGKNDPHDSDDGFVENEAPPSKKSKGRKESNSKDICESKNAWELSSGKQPRFVEVTEFKGANLINIREFYEKDGGLLPGKKGISLNIDQYKALVRAIPAINAYLKEKKINFDAPTVDLNVTATERDQGKSGKQVESARNISNTASNDEDDGDRTLS
ncbi:BgTH12-00814 [Blumeria graminis f. sp. triticale]|uniref:Bgt-5309 n=3 Tax=Blumeria graminis TaxID=34373 RepID=A0A381LG62_BLUGR|nr:Transcriptional Coactivator p15 PC4 [Blumeria graminis f. sp. tritici 96224]CAD6505323.1 BgTH12-00814 [Blumeria graminis f. sp. triticale]VDB93337.1 Bgt-5309 [Blumeria graminis f. sp. tritici]